MKIRKIAQPKGWAIFVLSGRPHLPATYEDNLFAGKGKTKHPLQRKIFIFELLILNYLLSL